MHRYAEVDTTDHPMVIVTFTGQKATEENFSLYLKEVEQCYQNKDKIVIIFDGRKATFPGLRFQRMQAEWLKKNQAMVATLCMGTIYIISSIWISLALRMILFLQPQPTEFTIVSSLSQAMNWAVEKLFRK
jgi:hypothetical protein